jgi:hypothetical protein
MIERMREIGRAHGLDTWFVAPIDLFASRIGSARDQAWSEHSACRSRSRGDTGAL